MQIQFIWCGKMWEIILQNLLEFEKKENIFVETKTINSKKNLAKKYWINIWMNKNTEIIFLLVKPGQFDEINFEVFGKNKIIFSFIAGLTTKKITKKTKSTNLIRAMPNTPILVWKWVIWYFVSKNLEKKYLEFFIKIFSKNSSLIKCETEERIDKITALSGSGPAYFYFITEILEQKAIEFWFSKIDAEIIANNTFIWASELLTKSWEKVKILRQNISSKWWTTQEAIQTFEKNNFWEKFMEWIEKAYEKAKNLNN